MKFYIADAKANYFNCKDTKHVLGVVSIPFKKHTRSKYATYKIYTATPEVGTELKEIKETAICV